MKKIFFILIFLFTVLCFTAFYFGQKLYHQAPSWIDQKVTGYLNKSTKSHIQKEELELDILNGKLSTKELTFKNSQHLSQFKEVHLSLKTLNVFPPHIPFNVTSDNGHFLLIRDENGVHSFPHFQKISSFPKSRPWFSFQGLTLKDIKLHWIDNLLSSDLKISFHSPKIILSYDANKKKMSLDSVLYFLKNKESFIHVLFERSTLSEKINLTLNVQGYEVPLSLFSDYQSEITKYNIEGGEGNLNLDIKCVENQLFGKGLLRIKNLHFVSKNKNIFNQANALGGEFFLKLLKENQGKLELDFYISGSIKKPILKGGALSKKYLLNTPVEIAKDSLNVVENLLDTLLLGMPSKLFKKKEKSKSPPKDQ